MQKDERVGANKRACLDGRTVEYRQPLVLRALTATHTLNICTQTIAPNSPPACQVIAVYEGTGASTIALQCPGRLHSEPL